MAEREREAEEAALQQAERAQALTQQEARLRVREGELAQQVIRGCMGLGLSCCLWARLGASLRVRLD